MIQKCIVSALMFIFLTHSGIWAEEIMDTYEISIDLAVPNPSWTISITEVWQVKDQLWAISRVNSSSMMAVQMITTISDTITVNTSKLPVRHFVIGKTWKWENKESCEFIKSVDDIAEYLSGGKKISIKTLETTEK